MDKTIIVIVIAVILAAGLFWGFQSGFFTKIPSGPINPVIIPSGTILFYGQGCPHCKVVDDFDKTSLFGFRQVPENNKVRRSP